MTIAELLAETARRGLQLRRKGGEIVLRGDHAQVDTAYIQTVRSSKSMLLPVLCTAEQQPWLSRQTITPDMLPLIALTQAELDALLTQIPGGAANVQDIYPLAPVQEGFLFHHLMDAETDPYVLSKTLAFRDRDRLEHCLAILQDIVNRHDILRTAFFWEGLPEPVQVVLRNATIAVELLAVPGANDSIAELRDMAGHPQHRLDFHQAPLLRAFVAYDAEQDRWLMELREHHLIGDHMSFDLLVDEFRAHLVGKQALLAAPQPFRNFVAQARLGISSSAHEGFFRAMLGDVEEPTAPFGLTEVRGDGRNVREHMVALPRQLVQTLRSVARERGVGLASLCHLAWALVLARASDRCQIVFGTVLYGRMTGAEASDRIMGPCINSLPIRIDVDRSGVLNGLTTTHARLTELLIHEHASLAQAQRCSALPSGMPLFSSLFNYRHSPSDANRQEAALDGIEWIGSHERTNYAFDLSINDSGDGLELVAQVDARVDAQRVCRMMETALQGLASTLTSAPDTPLNEIDVLPIDDRRRLQDWNDTTTDYPHDRCVHDLFEAQAALTPDATALRLDARELSYGALNTEANRFARYLAARGIGPEDRVAICVERSFDMVIALLAILKAGAAYLPLDPMHPAERQRFTLEDAAPRLLLTQTAFTDRFADIALPCVLIDGAEAPWKAASPTASVRAVRGPNAYSAAAVIYTSGSTGRPKGVVIEHRNLVNRITLMGSRFGLSATDVVLQKSALTVDVSAWEIFAPLSVGAEIVLARPDGDRDATYLAQTVSEMGITMVDFVPAMLGPFLDALQPSTGLRHVFCGGDVLPPALLNVFRGKCASASLHNMYGPTETTIDATVWSCSADNPGLSSVPIGRPLPNSRIYILDAQDKPVPIGVIGEIHIGGAGVTRGYLNRPDLTVERFVDDPFADIRGARMYRTGDLGRWLADGNIEFLGRSDFQVKLRGFRIELGEIEARLAEHGAVREAVVLVREDHPGDKRLVAYIVPVSDAAPEAEALRVHLATALPEHMVPAAYVVVDNLPLSANGKLDRKALPAPGIAAFATSTFEPPQGETETLIAMIWQDILGVVRVGRDDNFFKLGGNSLLAITLIERLRQRQLKADIRSLFNAPTPARLAQAITGLSPINIAPNGIPPDCDKITPAMLPLARLTQTQIDQIAGAISGGTANIQDIYPLAPLQEGILFHFLLRQKTDPYLSSAVMRFRERAEIDRGLRALQSVIDRHDILRTAILWEGLPEPLQVVQRGARLVVESLVLSDEADDRVAELCRLTEHPQYRIDLRQAPLLRAFIAPEPDGHWLLLLREHHLIGDHTSFDMLADEVRAHLLGKQAQLARPQPFRNFVAQARLGISRQEHEEFFRAMLGDVEETTAPFGLLQVYGDGGDIREHIAELPRELADRLRRASRDVGVGLASLCHLAWALVVARTSGRDDVVFGTVIFGRMNAETAMDHVMGPFFNSLPIRLTIDKTSVIEAVRKTQRLLTELLVHEHASLAQAQRCSAVPPGLPLFSSLFNYRHVAKAERTDFDVVPLEISTVQSSERTNYPIGLSVDDRGTDLRLVAHVEPSVDPRQVCRMMETALEALASHLAEAPQHSLSEIDVLPVETRAQIMEEWNATSVAYPAERYVHELFEMQARRIPDAAAVVHQGQSLTYAELNIRANRLAHHLIERGVRPDDRVAICVERSLEMVVGLLAVLKAGAAYLPVDPSYPVERQAHMLTDSAPAVVLTREADTVKDAMDLAHAKGLSDLPVIDLVQDAWRLNGCTNANPDPGKLGLTPNHLAYVIYTSGSTGQPKGVMVEHRGFVNLVTEQIRAFALRPGSRCLQFASMSFDASASEIFTTLCSGAALHLVPRRRAQDTSWLQRELADKAVTHVTLPSAVLANFTDDIALPRLETLVVAGDPLAPALANRWRHGRRLINAYGPTEATVCASMHLCVEDYDLQVPIGRPIANGRIYILDGRGRPVPIGVAGEIHIGGVGVARGYLNRPELTAQRFLDDPYVPCGRVYRTGDLGRWRADGDIEFLGRNDFQVKLRGFRVELGEIEAKLAEHAAVREAVVLVREDQPGDKRLVAYVVPVLNARPEAKDLRVHVAAGLPEHMVPAAYVILDTLPLGPNGKPDRRALPAPDLAALATTAFERPRDGIETRVATIWQELLDIKRIGRRDNFFDLGGNSLLAVSMISHLQSQFDVTVDLAELFQKPMLADVAELIVLLQLEQFESDDLADALDQLERS